MAVDFSGTWTSCKTEGWAEFLQKTKVPKGSLPLPADIKVTEEISQCGDVITIKSANSMDTGLKEKTINVGSNFITEMPPGTQLEFSTAWEGKKLVLRRIDGDGTSTRMMEGDQMVLVVEHEGTVAKTYYEKA
ncbi:uncharacterized protein LOC117291859 [Asterias rubens]|uniref:uncharacterized protein LOC117291859 n=1 Tax=Asterias rubens TaxID=7604 RepID=UPI001454EEBA|nr:uncharacterized protein LOC117291859 [Asterias rubens]XP_033629695.1 uncharacterized protein LOC117291859 [Asterias rubens]